MLSRKKIYSDVYTHVCTLVELFHIPARLVIYYEHLTEALYCVRLLCVYLGRERERLLLYCLLINLKYARMFDRKSRAREVFYGENIIHCSSINNYTSSVFLNKVWDVTICMLSFAVILWGPNNTIQ